jgi:hypothetical protein
MQTTCGPSARSGPRSPTTGLTLPFPERGPLIKQIRSSVDQQMSDLKAELDDAVRTLDQHFDELKQAAPSTSAPSFNGRLPGDASRPCICSTSNIEPPDYLLGPRPPHQQEQDRVARFEKPSSCRAGVPRRVRQADHLTNGSRLQRGQRPDLPDSAIDNLCDSSSDFAP